MDVVVGDMNGGNAEVARDDSNLEDKKIGEEESKAMDVATENNKNQTETSKMDEDEVNGDDKAIGKKQEAVALKRRMRKSKSNSTSSVENDAKPKAKGLKRKLSTEPDVVVNSDEADCFIGFSIDSVSTVESGLQILQKLIAEIELEEANATKRRRTSTKPSQKPPPELKPVDLPEQNSTVEDNAQEEKAETKSKEKEEKPTEEPKEVTNEANNVDTEVNMANPLFKEPFKHGWKRELIYKGGLDGSPKKTADIFYYSPKGKKVRNLREVAECLTGKELTVDNFTFHKEPIGLDDPALEIIRDAKRLRSEASTPASTPAKKTLNKRASVGKKAPTPPPASTKATGKVSPPKITTPTGFKVKVPAKRGSQKKETQSTKDNMLPPQWSSPTVTRRSQAAVEKITSPKNKRLLKAKLQEPCSLRCSLSMGGIPSLQCRLCLCLYHPECVGSKSSNNDEYICKNCQMELDPSNQQQQQPPPAPPPLIPISMIGSHGVKSKLSMTSAKTSKSATTTSSSSSSTRTSKIDEPLRPKSPKSTTGVSSIDSSWLVPPGREFLHSHDGSIPKPAQNIAVMGGKRYIVVPKNNDMAVQPAIPIRADKNYEKQFRRDSSITNISSQISGEVPEPTRRVNHEEKENKSQNRKKSTETQKKTGDVPPAADKVHDAEPAVQTMELQMDVESVELDKNPEVESRDDARAPEESEIERSKKGSEEHVGSSGANVPGKISEEVCGDTSDKTKVPEELAEGGNDVPGGVGDSEASDVAKEITETKKSTVSEELLHVPQEPSEVPEKRPASEESANVFDGVKKPVKKMKMSEETRCDEESKDPNEKEVLEAADGTQGSENHNGVEEPMDIQNDEAGSAEKVVSNEETEKSEEAEVERAVVPARVEKKKVYRTKKKLLPMEVDPKQHFMVSVCAGYDALSRIFQYLKVQELLRAARVCRMWRDLAAHPVLWKTVRMKNSQVTDWDGLAASLRRHGTQHLDLREMLVSGESDDIWEKFAAILPSVPSLIKLELCRCPASVVEQIFKSCPQLEVLSAMTIKCDSVNVEELGNLKRLTELRLKAISGMSIVHDLSPLEQLTSLTQLSLTSVKELGKKKIEVLGSLTSLETLELGECSDFPDKFGTDVLMKLTNLERLRLEKGQGSCCTFDILEGISKLEKLVQLELVNFDVKNGFDKYLASCKNIKRLLIIPTYISQSATSNNMVLGGVTELSENLTHFVWGVTLELLRVTELFVDQCNQMNKQASGDSIPVLKPVPCLKLIEEVQEETESSKADEKQTSSLSNPQVDILSLPRLQKLLLTALPKTRVKILRIPFQATWRQTISDSASQ